MLYTTKIDAARLQAQTFTPILIGGYDGNQNYGDVLQCVSTLTSYSAIYPDIPVAVIGELDCRPALESVREQCFPPKTMVLYYGDRRQTSDLIPLIGISRGIGLHFYGGGYVNDMWGARKRMMADAVISKCHPKLSILSKIPIVMTGLQVSAGAEANRWKDLFSAARFVGVRDRQSAAAVETVTGYTTNIRAEFCGDDALPSLAQLVPPRNARSGNRIAVHINQADYSTADAAARMDRVVDLVSDAARSGATSCDIIIGYHGARAGEWSAAETLKTRLQSQNTGILSYAIRNLFDEAIYLKSIGMDYDLVISCSYHVALTALAAGCPTILLNENNYYNQKNGGLVDQFPLAKTESIQHGSAQQISFPLSANHRHELETLVSTHRNAFDNAIGLLFHGADEFGITPGLSLNSTSANGPPPTGEEFDALADEVADATARLRMQVDVLARRAFGNSTNAIAAVERHALRLPVSSRQSLARWFASLRTQMRLLGHRCRGGRAAVKKAILSEIERARTADTSAT